MHLLKARVKCLLNTPPKQINPQKPENTHKGLQTAHKRSDLNPVVCRLLGSEDHPEPRQLPADQYISHIFHSLHRKYSSKFLWIPTRTPLEDHCSMNSAFFSTLLKPRNYCATMADHRWKTNCLYSAKIVLSNYTSKEQVLRRDGETKPPLRPSEAFLQGNCGTAASSPGSASTAPLSHCQTQSQACPASATRWTYLPKLIGQNTNGVFLIPSCCFPLCKHWC